MLAGVELLLTYSDGGAPTFVEGDFLDGALDLDEVEGFTADVDGGAEDGFYFGEFVLVAGDEVEGLGRHLCRACGLEIESPARILIRSPLVVDLFYPPEVSSCIIIVESLLHSKCYGRSDASACLPLVFNRLGELPPKGPHQLPAAPLNPRVAANRLGKLRRRR